MPLTLDSSIGEVLGAGAMFSDPALLKMMSSAPIGRMVGFPGTGVTAEQVQILLDQANDERGVSRPPHQPGG